jgi:pimeloyl-ACP methyl ester carboxylesterase
MIMRAWPDRAPSPYGEGVRSYDLVLLHGQPGLGADWEQVLARLPTRIRAVAPDRPGYGSSFAPGGNFATNARAVLDDLDARGIERAVLVGHSYGGGVALTVAALAPERVEGLILLASVGPGCTNGWDWLLAAPGAGGVCALFAWHLTPWFARARLRRMVRQRGPEFAPRQHVNWYVWGHSGSEHYSLWRTFLTEQRALVADADQLAQLATSVHLPVLLLADPQDTLVPISTARELSRLLPDARLQLVDGLGHHLPMRGAEMVAQTIVTFLTALDSGSASARANGAGPR